MFVRLFLISIKKKLKKTAPRSAVFLILIAISSKIRLMRSLAMSIFLYAGETWTITADIERGIQTLEMICFRELLVSRTEITYLTRK